MPYEAGAQRVELCDNPIEGGHYPELWSNKKESKEKVPITLISIIRPRAGNYLGNIMMRNGKLCRHDIKMCRELGVKAFRSGYKLINGHIDIDRLKELLNWPADGSYLQQGI